MKRVLSLVPVLAVLAGACAGDERYEGYIERCDDDRERMKALVIFDTPRAPNAVTGWVGYADDDARDTWNMAEIQDGESAGPGQYTFTAEYFFSSGGNTNFNTETEYVVEVELEPAGNNEFEGEVEINTTTRTTVLGNTSTSSSTVRCEIELAPPKN